MTGIAYPNRKSRPLFMRLTMGLLLSSSIALFSGGSELAYAQQSLPDTTILDEPSIFDRDLPPLISSVRVGRSVEELDRDSQRRELAVRRAQERISATGQRAATAETDPYAPVGSRVGGFNVFSTLEQFFGVSTNGRFTATGSDTTFSQTRLNVRGETDWSRNQLQFDATGEFNKGLSGDDVDQPRVNLEGGYRHDFGGNVSVTARAGYNFTTENLSSNNLVLDPVTGVALAPVVTDRPGISTLSGSLEAERRGGKIGLLLRGSIESNMYEDANLSDGMVLDQSDRDNTLYRLTGRASYEASPAVTPFVEASIGRREYNNRFDRNLIERSGDLFSLRGGVAIDLDEKLRGEIAVGYARENFDDATIKSLSGATIDGTLIWSPDRLTNVNLGLSTVLAPATSETDNGSLSYVGRLGVSRRIRPDILLDGNLVAQWENFDVSGRKDFKVSADAGVTYWFNRMLAVQARASYENFDSSEPDTSYDAAVFRLGVKIQR